MIIIVLPFKLHENVLINKNARAEGEPFAYEVIVSKYIVFQR